MIMNHDVCNLNNLYFIGLVQVYLDIPHKYVVTDDINLFKIVQMLPIKLFT